ncbi:MAG: HAMP domain-containing sensor histidine kinase [Erysipelotrichaceae bacterium]|nr:HAMP domain-containing sensor histidine kinase [Erysipelotrichaceae bacterium]
MKLKSKMLLFNVVISVLVVSIIVLYFLYMIPSLYVENRKQDLLNEAYQNHVKFLKSEDYLDQNTDLIYNFSLKIYKDSYTLHGYSTFLNFTYEIEDPEIRKQIDVVREKMLDKEFMKQDNQMFWDTWSKSIFKRVNIPMKNLKYTFDPYVKLSKEQASSYSFYRYHEDTILIRLLTNDNKNSYLAHYVITYRDEYLALTIHNGVTPKIADVYNTLWQALPVIVLVLLVVLICFAHVFSYAMVHPITVFSNTIKRLKKVSLEDIQPIQINRNDEIGLLTKELNELYAKLRENHEKEKLQAKKQEVFLLGSSHQLKTPIQSAMLLVEGMINKVGRYQDRDVYLVKVKEQLKLLRNMIDEILSLSRYGNDYDTCNIHLNSFINTIIHHHQLVIENKQLTIKLVGNHCLVSNEEILYKILDNLMSNAISYTSEKGTIKVAITNQYVRIENGPAVIEEELLETILEPFVTSFKGNSGKGLGLYVVDYFTKLLGYQFHIENQNQKVVATLYYDVQTTCIESS